MARPVVEKHRCCICGTKKSKTWRTIKPKCEACSDHCENWHTAANPQVCPFHRFTT